MRRLVAPALIMIAGAAGSYGLYIGIRRNPKPAPSLPASHAPGASVQTEQLSIHVGRQAGDDGLDVPAGIRIPPRPLVSLSRERTRQRYWDFHDQTFLDDIVKGIHPENILIRNGRLVLVTDPNRLPVLTSAYLKQTVDESFALEWEVVDFQGALRPARFVVHLFWNGSQADRESKMLKLVLNRQGLVLQDYHPDRGVTMLYKAREKGSEIPPDQLPEYIIGRMSVAYQAGRLEIKKDGKILYSEMLAMKRDGDQRFVGFMAVQSRVAISWMRLIDL